jgi:hypothetical protein
MMPGLKKIADSIARNFRGDISDFDSEIVEGFLHALNSVDPTSPSSPGTEPGQPGTRTWCLRRPSERTA